jgi:hypothetical protein
MTHIDIPLCLYKSQPPSCSLSHNISIHRFANSALLPLSKADIIAIGAVVAIKHCGGPIVPFRSGRLDVPKNTQNNVTVMPTDPFMSLDQLKVAFYNMGLTPAQMLLLVTGSHTMGGAHGAITPKITNETFIPFDTTPGVFDNNIFKQVLTGNCVLPIDCAMKEDTNLLSLIKLYADNETAFFHDYALAFNILTELTTQANYSDYFNLSIPTHPNLLPEGTTFNTTVLPPIVNGSLVNATGTINVSGSAGTATKTNYGVKGNGGIEYLNLLFVVVFMLWNQFIR